MADAEVVLTALTVAAGLALVVERVVEVLKYLIDMAGNGIDGGNLKKSLETLRDLIKQANDALTETKALRESAKNKPSIAMPAATSADGATEQIAADHEPDEIHLPPPIPVVPYPGQDISNVTSMLFIQLMAAGLGIVLAHMFDLHLISLLLHGNSDKGGSGTLDLIVTGLVIGGGSQPVHVLIRFLNERKVSGVADIAVPEEQQGAADAWDLAAKVANSSLVAEQKEPDPLAWRPIPYDGGVRATSLEKVHLRSGNPNLIVYHHTAMASFSPFSDVVDEILTHKKWLTAYHCVIMPDGTIEPFCRWDRNGNHAKGRNDRSLGIAFHGNFHTKLEQTAQDKFANSDGRFGNQRPTEAQLHAGARVIALWMSLYEDIGIELEKSVLPHYAALPNHTVCPGSNFPHAELRRLVRLYVTAWQQSETSRQGINGFKQLPYVYA
jgi:hypothetical protein